MTDRPITDKTATSPAAGATACAQALQRLADLEDEDTTADDEAYLERAYVLARKAVAAVPTNVQAWQALGIHAVLQGMMTIGDDAPAFFDEALAAADRLRDLGVERRIWEATTADVLVHAASQPWAASWLDEVRAVERITAWETVWADIANPSWGFVAERGHPRARMIRPPSSDAQGPATYVSSRDDNSSVP